MQAIWNCVGFPAVGGLVRDGLLCERGRAEQQRGF